MKQDYLNRCKAIDVLHPGRLRFFLLMLIMAFTGVNVTRR